MLTTDPRAFYFQGIKVVIGKKFWLPVLSDSGEDTKLGQWQIKDGKMMFCSKNITQNFFLKSSEFHGAEEIAQWLTALAGLIEDMHLVLSIHMMVETDYNSSPRGS